MKVGNAPIKQKGTQIATLQGPSESVPSSRDKLLRPNYEKNTSIKRKSKFSSSLREMFE